jgi:LuxR family transcriptional regulator, maltose regulon positive regulatory protein
VRCSVLERLCGSLCDAVLARSGSAAVLEALDRANLFVVPLDQHREWYRCHGLFRDALRRELDRAHPGEAAALLRRAADWCLAADRPDDAVGHLLAAGDAAGAVSLLRDRIAWFTARGALATYVQLGERTPAEAVAADPRLCVSLAWAAGLCGRRERVLPWLAAAERAMTADTPPLEGWRTLEAAAATLRAAGGDLRGDVGALVAQAERAVALEPDPGTRGYVVSRVALGTALQGAQRYEDAAAVLTAAWSSPAARELPALLRLPTAGMLAGAHLRAGRLDVARRLCAAVAPEADEIERAWGDAAAPATAPLRFVEALLTFFAGDVPGARVQLRRAAELARVWGNATQLVAVLASLADAELACGDRAAARAALAEARDTADAEPVLPIAAEQLAATEARIGRASAGAAVRTGGLAEQLTDRELSILRALQSPLSQREIGRELYLSVNTVKGYTRSLYRKLGASARSDAVEHARALGLI